MHLKPYHVIISCQLVIVNVRYGPTTRATSLAIFICSGLGIQSQFSGYVNVM